MSYSNPIVPGFAPDPSVVYVDGVYYLVNSSFHVFPGLPIYASTDLKSWVLVGNAISRRSQLSLKHASTQIFPGKEGQPAIVTGGLYAPTIRYQKGTFYVICTNIVFDDDHVEEHFQNFYVTCTDVLANEWSDAIRFKYQGIDPSFFFDDNGDVYVHGSYITDFTGTQPVIKQFQIDIKTGKPLSDLKEIWKGAVQVDPEGPHIYRKDGFYYLLVAEGGTYEHHMVNMARSTSVWGPYESFEQNPVLTADGTDGEIQHVGHADLFEDQYGDWWAVSLGVRKRNGRYPMGRETFLTSVEWPEGSWPKFAPMQPKANRPNSKALSSSSVGASLSPAKHAEYLYIRDPASESYKTTDGMKQITMTQSENDFSARTGPVSFIGIRQQSLSDVFNVSLRLNEGHHDVKAGLAVYKDSHRHAEIFYDFSTSAVKFSITNKVTGLSEVIVSETAADQSVDFRIVSTEETFEFWFRDTQSSEWKQLKSIDSNVMTGHDFTGTIVGPFAFGQGDCKSVEFENFIKS